MKILIITQRDPFFTDSFLKEFDNFNLSYTLIECPNFKKGLAAGIKKAVQLYGFYGFFKLVILRIFKFQKLRLKNCVKIEKVNDIDNIDMIFLKYKDYDIVCSVSAPMKIDVSSFSTVSKLLNIHCGTLPEYAGMMPIFWQIFDGKNEIDIILQVLGNEIDTGSILLRHKFPIGSSLFKTSVEAKVYSAHLLREYIERRSNFVGYCAIDKSEKIILRKFPTKTEIKTLSKKFKLI